MRKFKLHDGKKGAALTIRVTPRSRRTEVAGVMENGTLKVRITEPPVEGKANAALIRYLAKLFKVRKSRIEIVAGHKGLDKIVSILDITAAEAESCLEEWINK
jgi:uncharacterized protein (TIGR00251 family)